MTDTIDSEAAASARRGPGTAGAALRSAREAAGLSVDAVAQQLKLAPRQVTALEEDDFQRLPGRTFARGFARNYARFLQLDPDAVLALMPAAESTPSLERPTLAAARRPMGEIPVDRIAKPPASRRLFALLLILAVAAAGYYEYMRQQGGVRRDARTTTGASGAARTLAPAPAATTPPPAATGTTTTALPNPVAESSPPAESNDAATPPGASTPGATSAALPAASTPGATVPAASPASAPAAASDAALVLAFKGTSWAEVKDASGRVILQMTGGAGMTQTVTGTPPFELALGNAPDVAVTFRGQVLDLAPYTRGAVARVALK